MPAADILTAIARAFRAKVAVRGVLAESQLVSHLEGAMAAGRIDAFERLDKDGQHDANVTIGGRSLRIECKAVHPRPQKRPPSIVVETQKTRATPGHPETRFYRVDQFDIVAACLFPYNGEWSFLFALSAHLKEHRLYPGRLAAIQKIVLPVGSDGVWTPDLASLVS
jgi:hypothetical protein